MSAVALLGAAAWGDWTVDVRTCKIHDADGKAWPWMAAHERKIPLKGTVRIGGDGPTVERPAGGTDWRHVFRNVGGIETIVFGSETANCFKPDCYIQSLYAGFPGCGNVTSIVSRVSEPMAWNKKERWSEGLPCVLFEHCAKLKNLELAGFLTSAVGLPKVKPGQCRVVVPANHPNWVAFAVTPGNLKSWAKLTDAERAAYWGTRPAGAEKVELAPYGQTLKENAIGMPEGYWLVPRARYALTIDLAPADGWSLYALSPAPEADGTYAAMTDVTAVLKGPDGQEKTLVFPMTCDRGLSADLKARLALDAAAAAKPKFEIVVDPKAKPIKDVSKSPCFPDLGLAGDNVAPGIFNDEYLSFVKFPEKTARAYRESGVWLVRPCGELETFRGIAKHAGKDRVFNEKGRCQWLHPKFRYAFYKEQGIKMIVCLNIWDDKPSNVSNLVAYLDWVKANGFADQISAFEMCNEAFYGKDPEGFARYWHNLLPLVKARFPKTPIGVPLAEYCAGDPDIAAVKARLLGKTDLGGDYFTANNLNKWSARTVVALSNDWKHISHVIYHVYGTAGAYGCSMTGFSRFRNFPKLFPQVKDKRWLITEWRPWSDGSEQLMRSFREAVWSGMYIQTAFWQPELDGFTLHELNSIGGVMYYSANGKYNQYYDSWENGRDFRAIGPTATTKDATGDLRYERSGMGEVFRLYNQAILTHPRILCYGSYKYGPGGGAYASADYDSGSYKAKADCVWTALLNQSPSSLCLMFANGTDDELTVPVRCKGYRTLSKSHRFVTMPDERYLNMRDVLGEEKMWKTVSYETVSDGRLDEPQVVIVPPRSVGTVMIGLRRWDEWHAVSYGRPMVQRTIDAAKAKAPKGAKPSVECCGVERGKVRMVLPDGYPNHPEVKANNSARQWAEKIGKDKKLDAAAIAEAKKQGYFVIDNGKDAAWLFKATDVPDPAAAWLRDQLREMGGF